VIAKAPAKINLILRVGAPDDSGYHPLVTVFQALDMWDEVAITPSDTDHLVVDGPGDVSGVPTDQTNIVWKAVESLASIRGHREPLAIAINKTIPVAGGMAGGSADGAAALVAVNELWHLGLTSQDLASVAATLGADVPFTLLGGLALGEGRGDILTPLTRHHPLHCVVVTSSLALSTPLVYTTLDEQRGGSEVTVNPLTDAELAHVTGSRPEDLIDIISNDLEPATLQCAPIVGDSVDALRRAGALVSLVSGSGPTVWGLCRDQTHAADVAAVMTSQGFVAKALVSTPLGAHLISSLSSPTEARSVP
jgi:4-diphosphocytidyl-2C-methyl-D-erythritol kinase